MVNRLHLLFGKRKDIEQELFKFISYYNQESIPLNKIIMSELDLAISSVLLGARVTTNIYRTKSAQQRKCVSQLLKRNAFIKHLKTWVI